MTAAVFCYILPLYDHPIECDWAKIESKIGQKFAALIAANWPVQQWHNAGEPTVYTVLKIDFLPLSLPFALKGRVGEN